VGDFSRLLGLETYVWDHLSVTLETVPCPFHFTVGAEQGNNKSVRWVIHHSGWRKCLPTAVPPHLHFGPETISPQCLQNPIKQSLILYAVRCVGNTEKKEKKSGRKKFKHKFNKQSRGPPFSCHPPS